MRMATTPTPRSIPMLDLGREYRYMKRDIDRAIEKCLDHQKWILGPEVQELEEKVSDYLQVSHCVGASSGTDALVLALRALAIKLKGEEYFGREDQIITTPFTFTATGDAILRAGATPVFVDIDPRTYNIDPVRIREYLTQSTTQPLNDSTNVVGIIPVHLYGHSCEMDEIMTTAQEFGLFVMEDVAQAFGGMWRSQKLGSVGQVGAFSFFPSKNLGGFGDGGMIATSDPEISELVRMLLKHGGKDKYNVDHIGYNARLDTLQAAVLLAKLSYVDQLNQCRRRIAETYSTGLRDLPGVVLPVNSIPCRPIQGITSQPSLPPGHVFHQYTVRVRDGKRNELQTSLQKKGIATMVYYPLPLHKMKVFGKGRTICSSSLSHAEEACEQVLSLPIEPLLDDQDVAYVCDQIRRFFR